MISPKRYGDKVPQSVPGRVFAMIWSLVGICLISIFTATTTTMLSDQADFMTSIDLLGDGIGVINGSIERHLAIQMGSTPKGIRISSCEYCKAEINTSLYSYNGAGHSVGE